MNSVPRNAHVAVIVGALGLAVATSFATALNRPGVARAADITCESKSSGKPGPFYQGDSASYAYDQRFAGGPTIPGLSTHTPQGVAAWFHWSGPNQNLLVVTAYQDGQRAHLIGIDPANGNEVGTVAIAPSHVGGIAITMGWAFVSGEGNVIRKYRLSQLKNRMTAPGTPYLKQIGTARKVYGADFISSYGDNLYAGRFSQDGREKMYRYKVAADGSLATQAGAYEVPKKTQGLLVTANRFIYSTSYGNDQRSNINVVDGGARTISPGTARCFRAPSMSEGITEYGGKAYLVYESGAAQYVAKHPRNIIPGMHTASIGPLASYR
jgi:hypothetical protein